MIEQSTDQVAKPNIVRLAATGAFAVGIIFAICWVAAASGIVGSHAFIRLFTLEPTGSGEALAMGELCAVAFGAVAGGLIGVGYTLFGQRASR